MKHPLRSRNRAAVVFLVAVGLFLPALLVPRSPDEVKLRIGLLVASFVFILASGLFLLFLWDFSKRYTRLRAGTGVLAKWIIHAMQWEEFRRLSQGWDLRKDLHPNSVDLKQTPGTTGIEIIVARDAVLIGEDFHPLEQNVRITVRQGWMEFYQIIPKPKGTPLHEAIRLPVQPGKEDQASMVQLEFQKALRASAGVSLAWVALGIFVGLPAVAALVWLTLKLTGWV